MSKHQRLGYVRVSTVDQNLERQLDGVDVDKTFIDKCSGKDTDRPALQELLAYIREGDEVYVHDISRMARNVEDLLSLIRSMNGNGVTIHFMKESLTFNGESNPMQELMVSLLGAVYQFERSMLLERQREGIAKAKAAGKYTGGKPRIDREKVLECLGKGMSVRGTAKKLAIAPSTVQRMKAR